MICGAQGAGRKLMVVMATYAKAGKNSTSESAGRGARGGNLTLRGYGKEEK